MAVLFYIYLFFIGDSFLSIIMVMCLATPEQNATLTREPNPTSASPDRTPGNMVYVTGFGWIESQGPNHVEYAKDMYENGNKIGIME